MTRRALSNRTFTEALKAALLDELDQHQDELDHHATDTVQVVLTVKANRGRVDKLIFSRMTERDLRDN